MPSAESVYATLPMYQVADLGTQGGKHSQALGINASGQVTEFAATDRDGTHAFLYDGTPHDLGTFSGVGEIDSSATSINDGGQIADSYYSIADAAVHAFAWTPTSLNGVNGEALDLGTLGGNYGVGRGIYASGDVVGDSDMIGDAARHAFLFTTESGMFDLNLAIYPLSGWELSYASSIENPGQITLCGAISGETHAFLLSPVPEPGSLSPLLLCASSFTLRRRRRITGRLCLSCILTFSSIAHASNYAITDLGTLGGTYSIGFGINAGGQVTGISGTTGDVFQHAFLYDGAIHDLGTLGGTTSYGLGINSRGQVSGYAQDANDEFHAFIYDGTLNDIGTLGGRFTSATSINDSGLITGTSAGHAFLYDGTMHDLGTLGGPESFASGVNADGQVTGYSDAVNFGETHAFLYDGAMHDLGTLGGALSRGNGINAKRQVTGFSYLTGESEIHAFLWTPTAPDSVSGAMLDLGTLGGTVSEGYGVNAVGQVTGFSFTSFNAARHAFLYTSELGMQDLNTLIDSLSGWELLAARAINDEGQIVGSGIIRGEIHAFLLSPLLSPVPEPATIVLMALGLLSLTWRHSLRTTNRSDQLVYAAVVESRGAVRPEQ